MPLCRYPAGTIPQSSRLPSESGRIRGNNVSELRRQLQTEREAELSRLGSRSESSRPQQDGDRYSSVREQRLSEERRYREHAYGDARVDADRRVDPDRHVLRPRGQWDENEPPHAHRVRFGASGGNHMGRPLQSQGWDEEEKDLVQWARGQGRQVGRNRGRVLTPPNYESPQKQTSQVNVRLRSISAPVVAEGIAAIGARNSSSDKRSRQKQYAEELRAQIREKEEMKWREKLENQRLSPEKKTTGHSSDFADKPPRRSRLQEERLQPSYVDAGPERDYPRRRQKSPSRDQHERYTPYYPPPPPGPTPHYANYPQYYQPPWPPSAYHWPGPPYPPPMDPYYPHPLPPNPYLPPRQYDFRDTERRYRDQAEQEGGKRTRFWDEERSRTGEEIAGDPESTFPLSGVPGDSRGGKRLDKASYRAELEKQMREKKQRDVMTKVEKERYDVKKSAEIYDPFGKGGCGAPMRDRHGHVVADLKQMRKRNEEKLLRAGPETPPDSPQERAAGSSSGKQLQNQDGSPSVSRSQEWKASEEAQRKAALEEYRESLRRQVKEKEELKRQEKEKLKLEEQKELERLEAEQKKLKEDYQHEVERQRKKEAELKAKNEALQRQLEEKKRLDALKKQEEDLKEAELAAEMRNQALVERLEQAPMHPPRGARSPPIPTLRHKLTHERFSELPPTPAGEPQPNRSYSPPVPALRPKLQQHQQPPLDVEFSPRDENDCPLPQVPKSPPVPAVRNRIALGTAVSAPDEQFEAPPPRASNSPPIPALRKKVTVEAMSGHPSSIANNRPTKPPAPGLQGEITQPVDVIKGLSDLRKRLQLEQSRIAKQRGATADYIFTNAVLQKPRRVGPRVRGGDNGATAPPSATVKEFVALKSSRNEFLEKFPAIPQSRTDLEMEQVALLQLQEDNLARLRANPRATFQAALTNRQSRDRLLVSETARVPIDGSREAGVGLAGEGHRQRRRQWQQPPPPVPRPRPGSPGSQSQFSVATIDVDSLARRNEERQRRLDAILNASCQPAGRSEHHAPQAILHDFLRRTDRDGHALIKSSSRQSEQAMDCETGFHPIASELNTVM